MKLPLLKSRPLKYDIKRDKSYLNLLELIFGAAAISCEYSIYILVHFLVDKLEQLLIYSYKAKLSIIWDHVFRHPTITSPIFSLLGPFSVSTNDICLALATNCPSNVHQLSANFVCLLF